jgi:hypothetical protein
MKKIMLFMFLLMGCSSDPSGPENKEVQLRIEIMHTDQYSSCLGCGTYYCYSGAVINETGYNVHDVIMSITTNDCPWNMKLPNIPTGRNTPFNTQYLPCTGPRNLICTATKD